MSVHVVGVEEFENLAQRVGVLETRLAAAAEPWPEHMGIERAAAYLDMTPDALRKLVQRRKIAFSQEGPGCRLSFARADLDEYARRHRIDPEEVSA